MGNRVVVKGSISSCLLNSVIIFSISCGVHAQNYSVLYSFQGGSDGIDPLSGMVVDSAGNLYGATNGGGLNGAGTVFMLTPSTGAETLLHSFAGGSDGAHPAANLVFDTGGNLYSTTVTGGGNGCGGAGCGTIFKITPGSSESVQYSFGGGGNGYWPRAGLIEDNTGNFYGTTELGGRPNDNCGLGLSGCGIAFKLAPNGSESILYSFTGGNGGVLNSGLIADSAGNLYGTAEYGGSSSNCGFGPYGCGIVFKIAPNGVETILYIFNGGSDGAYPIGGLIADGNGNFYGTTLLGGTTNNCGYGPYGCGTVFEIAPNTVETVLHVFTGGNDGGIPETALVFDSLGNLYGTTSSGGSASCGGLGCGTVFELQADTTETMLHVFTGGNDGSNPQAALNWDNEGNLYGTTSSGGGAGCGGSGCGIIFELQCAGPENCYNAASQFESGWIQQLNPNGVWSYGYSSGFTGPVTLFDSTAQPNVNGPNAQYWYSSDINVGWSPTAEYNDGPAYDNGNVDFTPDEFLLVAGLNGLYADLVFTAPASGTYSVSCTFRGAQYGVGTVVGVVAGGTLVFNSTVTAVNQLVPFNGQIALNAGSSIVFSVGPGSGTQNTGVAVSISQADIPSVRRSSHKNGPAGRHQSFDRRKTPKPLQER